MNNIHHDLCSLQTFAAQSKERTKISNLLHSAANYAAAWEESAAAGKSVAEHRALALGEALCREPVLLLPHGRLVGLLHQVGPQSVPPPEPEYIRQARAAGASTVGSPGHISWRWDRVLTMGIDGITGEIKERLAAACDPAKAAFYRAALISWQRVLDWNDRHLAALRRERLTAPEGRHLLLDELIRIVEKVPRHPAQTFHEALQSFHFCYLAVMFENPYGGNSPGRMDYFLWPYLERDLAAGRLTSEQAGYLIDELFLRFEERLAGCDGWVETVMVGGTGPDGGNTVNALSYLLVESILKWRSQTHPAIYMRLRPDDPPQFRQLAVRYMLAGHNRGQLYNDPVCIRALVNGGIAYADAVHYTAGGCMEPGIQGGSSDLNFAFYWNTGRCFEQWLRQIQPDQFASFDALLTDFESALAAELAMYVRSVDLTAKAMAEFRPAPLLSSLIDDCLERGCDQQQGGARYPDYGYAPLAITSVADSLFAVKTAIYEQRWLDWPTLQTALAANFTGCEEIRARLLKIPKYGCDAPEPDRFCDQIMTMVCRISAQLKTAAGGSVRPMIFNFLWTPEVSEQLGARPDGSLAGDFIGHGMTPRSAAMTAGLSAAVNSCLKLNFEQVTGFATTMWDLDESLATGEVMTALVEVFMTGGGMVMQGNTTSLKEMELALEHPERYPDLIVRVGGFSAKFSSLNDAVRREIVRRKRQELTVK